MSQWRPHRKIKGLLQRVGVGITHFNLIRAQPSIFDRKTLIEGEKTKRYKKEKIKHRKGSRERTNWESNPRIHNGNMV
jgi:hypothetical protein